MGCLRSIDCKLLSRQGFYVQGQYDLDLWTTDLWTTDPKMNRDHE